MSTHKMAIPACSVVTRLPSHLPALQHLVHWIDAPRRSWRLSAVLCIWFCLTTVLPYSGEASSWELIKALLRGDGRWLPQSVGG